MSKERGEKEDKDLKEAIEETAHELDAMFELELHEAKQKWLKKTLEILESKKTRIVSTRKENSNLWRKIEKGEGIQMLDNKKIRPYSVTTINELIGILRREFE